MTRGVRVRLGAVSYLNARPLVFGLERHPEFDVRYDIPAECARLLHAHEIDVGLIPSIEYLRGRRSYAVVPGGAVISNGAVASVAIYTHKELKDIRTIAMDSSSRTSVALATILLKRRFHVSPESVAMAPDLAAMLDRADAALVIGDTALFLDHAAAGVAKFDLGELWTAMTGLPFVYAFWAGWPDALTAEQVGVLQQARATGAAHSDEVADAFYRDEPGRQDVARGYLRDNIRYVLGPAEIEGLKTFYRYAAEQQLAVWDGWLRFYHAEHHGPR